VAKGYSNVSYFRGGIPEWRYFNYPLAVGEKWQKVKVAKLPPLEFKKMLEENNAVFLLDTRSLDNATLSREDLVFTMDNAMLAGDYIKGALHCPLVFLEENHALIPKDRKIIVTDWIMKESIIAAKFLAMQGYDVIGILKGGTSRWQAEGLPLVRGLSGPNRQLACQ
jgi:rhodanese-related sulfurtransferase